jgi:hypothetical protein
MGMPGLGPRIGRRGCFVGVVPVGVVELGDGLRGDGTGGVDSDDDVDRGMRRIKCSKREWSSFYTTTESKKITDRCQFNR